MENKQKLIAIISILQTELQKNNGRNVLLPNTVGCLLYYFTDLLFYYFAILLLL